MVVYLYSLVHSLLEAGRLSLRAEPGGLSLMSLVLLAEEAEGELDAPRAAVCSRPAVEKSTKTSAGSCVDFAI